MEPIELKFIRYAKIDTESDENSSTYPSSLKQLDLAKLLLNELLSLGIEAELDEHGLVYAKIEGNPSLPKIGLIAHMDTAPTIRGGNFEPRFIYNYNGDDILLNENYVLSPTQFPSLNKCLNKTLIVTDGEHLLGADDKSGVAIIMSLAEYYQTHPEIDHAPIRICFTPDEEVGQGSLHFSVKKMDADIAYTIDGGEASEISFENFNAASCVVEILGKGIHPGEAKNKMINASLLAVEFNNLLNPDAIPSKTENYEGFIHLCDINGDVERCVLSYIIRDHDLDLLEAKKQELLNAGEVIKNKYKDSIVNIIIKDSYRNMRYYFDKDKRALDLITKAFDKAGLTYTFSPIRGGTDGASITYMGLPCPNIGTGGRNFHGRYEYLVVDEMYEIFKVLQNLLETKQ